MILRLTSLADTARLGRLLARAVVDALAEQREEQVPHAGFALLLQGELGSGKTTLAAAFVKALPGGEAAEVSSPSFTLCNVYPTRPQVFHADLYRAGPSPLPDEAAEALEGNAGSGGAVLVVEWPEYLLPEDRPADALAIVFAPVLDPALDPAADPEADPACGPSFDKPDDACDKVRMLKLEAHGPCAARVLAGLGCALFPEA